jgi:hypothetical protein
MKKIKLIIISTYIIFLILVNALTIFFILKTVRQGDNLYFQEKQTIKTDLPLTETEVKKIFEILEKNNLL